jgi:competence protein ComEA
MKLEAPQDALGRLDPAARHPAPGPRVRLGVGAAVVLLIIAVVTAVVVSIMSQPARRSEVSPNDGSAPSGEATAGPDQDAGGLAPGGVLIFVHVLGAVRHPGLFELHDGARVMDAVAAAGGLTESADPAGVNLARIVGDGEQLYVPQRGEAQPGAPPGATQNGALAGGAGTPAGRLNLNSATVADLDTLPRIGPALAQRIIDYRDANGRFGSVDDLRSVTGIGEKTFEGLKDLVTV